MSSASVGQPEKFPLNCQQSSDKAPRVAKVPHERARFPLKRLETFCSRNHKLPDVHAREGNDKRCSQSTVAHWGLSMWPSWRFQFQPGSLRRLPRHHIAPHCVALQRTFFGVLLFALLRSIWIGISFLLIEGFPCTFWFQIVDLGEFWVSYFLTHENVKRNRFMGISLSSRLVQRTKRRYNRVVERKVRPLSITICYSTLPTLTVLSRGYQFI